MVGLLTVLLYLISLRLYACCVAAQLSLSAIYSFMLRDLWTFAEGLTFTKHEVALCDIAVWGNELHNTSALQDICYICKIFMLGV